MSDRTTMGGKPVFWIPAKTVINWESGFKHKLLCDGPTFSLGTSCQYSCSFCYVPAQMKKQEPWLREHGMKGKFEDVVIRRENALDILAKQLRSPKGRELAKEKLVIYSSPLVDVAANMDLVKETVSACKDIIGCTNWDIRLLSKSNLLPKIAQGLEGCCSSDDAKQRIIYGVSTGTLNDNLAKAFEEGTTLVSKRIESLHWLQDNGYRTFGMICPSLPQPTMGAYFKFAKEAIGAIRPDKCEHVWAEVLNVRGDSIKRTYQALFDAGFNSEASEVGRIFDPSMWEIYARDTFEALYEELKNRGWESKLRFMQYVAAGTRDYWANRVENGAVLL